MKLKITVLGVAYEVDVEVIDEGGFVSSAPVVAMPVYHTAPPVAHSHTPSAAAPMPRPVGGSGILAPVSGTIVEILCKPGDSVKFGQTLLTLEAMKMETKIAADRDGVIKSVDVKTGENIREGQQLIDFE